MFIHLLCWSKATARGHQCHDAWLLRSMLDFAASSLNMVGWTMQVGSTFTFQLLRRPRDSIIPSRVYSSRAEGSQDAKEGAAAGSDPPPSTASCGAMSAAASWACRQGIDGKEGAGGKGGTASPRRVPASLFAKYTVVSKPEPLWQVAAAELAEHAAQVGRCGLLSVVVSMSVLMRQAAATELAEHAAQGGSACRCSTSLGPTGQC